MDLKKLFATQKVLRDRINYNETDRFEKLILALLVELGECANEQRSWKYWSKDQEPRALVEYGICKRCNGLGFLEDEGNKPCPVPNCLDGELTKNPLLEEYVDGLHFVLDIGIDVEYRFAPNLPGIFFSDITLQFIELNHKITGLYAFYLESGKGCGLHYYYEEVLKTYLVLGKSLGFTWEQIEQAYYAKNEINHIRQDNGY